MPFYYIVIVAIPIDTTIKPSTTSIVATPIDTTIKPSTTPIVAPPGK